DLSLELPILHNKDGTKKKPKRKYHSNYLITINTQKRFQDTTDPKLGVFHGAVSKILQDTINSHTIMNYIKIIEDQADESKIVKVKLIGRYELGPVTGTLHFHY